MRYVSVILFVIVLAAPFVLRKALVPHSADSALHAGAERLVIITPHPSDIRAEFARAFSAWHQKKYHTEVEIDFRIPGGSSDVKRQLEMTYRANRDGNDQLPADFRADISVAWGGGDFFFDRELKPKPLAVLLPFEMSREQRAEFRKAFPRKDLAGVRLYEKSVASFVPQLALADLNDDKGVGVAPGGGADIQFTQTNGDSFVVSLAGAVTLQEVINRINAAAPHAKMVASLDPVLGVMVVETLADKSQVHYRLKTLADRGKNEGLHHATSATALNASTALADLADATTPPTPQWVGTCLSSFGVCFNHDVYQALQLPDPSPERGSHDANGWHNQHGWHDLTDPKLAGFIVLADPAHSGSSAVAYQMVIQNQMAAAEETFLEVRPDLKPRDAKSRQELADNVEYKKVIAAGWKRGMSELVKIAANARYFTDSSPLVAMDVARGEAAAGMSIDYYARVTEEIVKRDRIQYLAPIGATAITPDPVAILYGTKDAIVDGKPVRNLTLAKHFIEFLLTPEAQRLWDLKPGEPDGPLVRSLRRMPIRQDVYRDQTGWADNNNPFESANGFNQRGEWMALFTDSRPIWVAAWIDSRDALKDAYGRILAIPDEGRRLALIEELANLPIEMQDIASLQIERTRIEKLHGELDEWRARQQIEWAETFRKHYREVGAKAQ